MGAFGLSQQLGIDQKRAKEFIDRYFERYPGVRAWLDRTVAEARRTAKTINFGIIYGMGAYGLSQQLGIDQKRA
jgi:DNA polymerase I-like protein with 3'-5' exonuclease and polymerase domains